jgi:type II secretory pathway pseudopilin PulG
MPRRTAIRGTGHGYALIALLLMVAVTGLALAAAAQLWSTVSRRDKEEDLIRIGLEFREAIRSYAASSPGAEQYPPRLEDLLLDPRFPYVKRHLRRIYADPLTGTADWGLLKSGEAIIGVHSLAEGQPLKTALDPSLGIADEAASYRDWTFVYRAGDSSGGAKGNDPDHPDQSPQPDADGSAAAHDRG